MLKRISPSRLIQIEARRICVIKPSALGDVAQCLPLLPALRARFPQSAIAWVVNRELADLLAGHPDLDELIPFDRHGSWANWLRLLRDLRRRRIDLVLDLQGLFRTGLMAAATGAAVRVGLQTAREGSHLAVHCTLPGTGRTVPAHARYWRVAEAFGRGAGRPQTLVSVPQCDRAWAEKQLLTSNSGPVLAIHAGARWETKRWPAGKFAQVAAQAVEVFGCSILLLGSRSELPVAQEVERRLLQLAPAAEVRVLAGETTLKQLACLLEGADVLLTNDSGPMHLAAGLGTPVVGIFTCTSPERSGPPGPRHELIATGVSCAASYRKRCPHSGPAHLACLDELDAERVWSGLVRTMEKNGIARRPAEAA